LDAELVGPLAAGEIRRGKLASLQSSDGTSHELALEIVGANDAAIVLHGGSVRENAGWQHVALRVVDQDGPEQSLLQPDQQGEWSGGHFRTDAQGQLYLSVATERLDPLPQGARQTILLEGVRSQDGTLLKAIPISIQGENDRALIQDQITLQPFHGEQSVALEVRDADGGIQQRLKPNQAGNWTHGKYWTDAAGQLVVSLDESKYGPMAAGQSRYRGRITGLQSQDATRQDVTVEWDGPATPVSMTLGITVREASGAQSADWSDAQFLPLAAAPQPWLPNQSGGWSHGAFHTDADGRLSVFVDRLLVGALAEGESLLGRLALLGHDGVQHTLAMRVLGGNDAARVVNPVEILELDGWQMVGLQLSDPDGVAQSRLAAHQSGRWRLGEYRTDADGGLSVQLDRSALGRLAAGERHVEAMPGLTSVDGTQLEVWVEVRGQNDAAQIQSRVTVSEAAGPQWVALTVTDSDGPAQSGLRPNQSALWSHGRYQTDDAGRLSLEIDRDKVGALALHESPRMGVIQDLKSLDGSCQDVVVEITGVNDAAQIQDRITISAERGWQAPSVTVFDPDGASQSGLLPNQEGFWEHGAFQTDAGGQLQVWFNHTTTSTRSHLGSITGLLSRDGSRQDVILEVSEPSGCALLHNYLLPDGGLNT
jgi:VCBS repeat-containing protein